MKYCIRLDQPMSGNASGESILMGCDIYGAHHDCEGCPNLKEMGDDAYNAISANMED